MSIRSWGTRRDHANAAMHSLGADAAWAIGRVAHQLDGTLWLPAHARCSNPGPVVLVHAREEDLLAVRRQGIQNERELPVRVSEPPPDIDGDGFTPDREGQDARQARRALSEQRPEADVEVGGSRLLLREDEEGQGSITPRPRPASPEIRPRFRRRRPRRRDGRRGDARWRAWTSGDRDLIALGVHALHVRD